MVCAISEIVTVRELFERCAYTALKKAGVRVPDTTSSFGDYDRGSWAALAADTFATACDFFAIGTNDLTQYTLAIDRTDQEVAHLYNPTHPAVLRLIHFMTGAALRARIPVSVCGEMAGDPRLAALLVGIGVRELSMASGNLLRVKQRIRQPRLLGSRRACTPGYERARPEKDRGDDRVLLGDPSAKKGNEKNSEFSFLLFSMLGCLRFILNEEGVQCIF